MGFYSFSAMVMYFQVLKNYISGFLLFIKAMKKNISDWLWLEFCKRASRI